MRDDKGRQVNAFPELFSDLSPAGKVLVSTMRRFQFGRFEGLHICNGDPVWAPPPRLVRVSKIGASDEPAIVEAGDWILKAAVRDLFREFAQVQNGTIDRVVFHRGLPCLVEVAIGSTGMDPAESAGRTEQ